MSIVIWFDRSGDAYKHTIGDIIVSLMVNKNHTRTIQTFQQWIQQNQQKKS